MMDLDFYVDAFEEEIAVRGVLAIELDRFVPSQKDFQDNGGKRLDILVEMLRVWMEHRWQAGHPVSIQDCLDAFPDEQFRPTDRERLLFEDRRLRQSMHANGDSLLNGTSTTSSRSHSRSIEELPETGTVWDDFDLLAILGAGAFAKVYLARQKGMANRLVALKLSFRKTLESEWLATLQHSAIVPIYSRHKRDAIYGICMPYLGNTTLVDILRESPPAPRVQRSSGWLSLRGSASVGRNAMLSTIEQRRRQIDTIVMSSVGNKPSDETKSIVQQPHHVHDRPVADSNDVNHGPRQASSTRSELSRRSYVDAVCWVGAELADALAYAHRNGIIHSDIKPANVLLGTDGQPRLLDFNVSYRGTSDGWIQDDMGLGGTVPYMSPEHRKAFTGPQRIDARSDIFSLGVVLFEMLTGELPSREDSQGANPRRLNPTVSPAMSAIIGKCLRTDPSDRYACADDLRDDLNAQFQHLPLIHQKEPSFSERIVKWAFRHPRLSSSLSVVSVASLLIGALVVGIMVRDAALQRADWSHRVALFTQRMPNSMALLTSLDAVPDLEPEAVRDLNETLGLIAVKRGAKLHLDPRWSQSGSNVVSPELRDALTEMDWLAKHRKWKESPDLLVELSTDAKEHESTNLSVLQMIREQHFYDAIPLLKRQVSKNPRDYVGWWLLGGCYQATQDFENAKQSFSICIALQPNTAIAHLNRGMASFSLQQFDEAADDFQRSHSLANWAWPLLNRALALQMTGQIDEAIRNLDQAIEQGFATVSVYRLRAELNLAKGNHAASIADKQQALQCIPTSDQQWIDRGLIELETDPIKSAEDFRNALAVNPNSLDAHQKLAYVYSELLHDPAKSLEHSNQLIALAPWQPTHLAGRAVLHARAGRKEAAKVDLRELETMNVRDGMVMYQIACGYSILAEQNVGEPQANNAFSKTAFHWLSKSIRSDATVWPIVQTDPDTKWLREQPQFQQIAAALTTLEMNSP